MKVFVTFLLIASAYASEIHEYAPPIVAQEARVTTGVSSQSRAQDNLGNYAFGYNEDHAEGGTFRKESGNAHGQVIGSYGLRVNDGRVRIVNYVADDFGFRASIATNEPGVAPQASAGTSISSPAGASVAPASAVVEEVHPVATDVHAAEPLVAAHGPVAVDAHGPAPIAAHAPVAVAAHGPAPIAAHGPAIAAPAYAAPYAGPVVHEAPATLIKNYAGSIYGPSLLTDNVIFSKPALAAAPLAGPSVAYEAPLSPNAYAVPAALQTHDGEGFYDVTGYYSNPSGIGYALGTNVGQFGYQLTYRKKKK